MFTFKFERQSYDRQDGVDPRRWSSYEAALAAAFAWQDDNTGYGVDVIEVEQ